MTSLHGLFHMHGFDYSHSTLLVTLQNGVSAGDMTTPLTVSITVGRAVLNNGAKALLLDVYLRLEAMRQLHVEGLVGWT